MHLKLSAACFVILGPYTLMAIAQPQAPQATDQTAVVFQDMSSLAGVITKPNWKYGGPCIADINNDGFYDFFLGNHDQTPIQLFVANGNGAYTEQLGTLWRADLHGMAAGDYDLDGDNDLLASLGGGNGTSPQPPRLLRNDDGKFTDITNDAGIADLGARGRSVRWVDLDSDGDLDMLQINAKQAQDETGPRNILFENLGDGTFKYRSSPVFEDIEAEKLLVTDFNGDHIADIITYSPWVPVTFWQGNNNFGFENANSRWLPDEIQDTREVVTVGEADIDNDGDLDYYLVRGTSTSDNAIHFDPAHRRLDICDSGDKGRESLTFSTEPWSSGIDLLDFSHITRGPYQEMPVFIGRDKTRVRAPDFVRWVAKNQAEGFPEEREDNGWYIGHVGDNQWRLEWNRNDNLAWNINASVVHVKEIQTEWVPKDLERQDVLLSNDGESFTDISDRLPVQARDNNKGVIPGDFNNDGRVDFFVYRYGNLSERTLDVLMINRGDAGFTAILDHGATDLTEDSHGDMGAAFDYDMDGYIDILSGDEDGSWHLYRNEAGDADDTSNHLLVRVGYSEKGCDPTGAEVIVTSALGRQLQLVGSGSSAFSQNLLDTLHFGLGDETEIKQIHVRWRDGTESTLNSVEVNRVVTMGTPADK